MAKDKKSNGNSGAPAQVEIPPDQQSMPEQPHEYQTDTPTVDLSPKTVPETPAVLTAKAPSYEELFAAVEADMLREEALEKALAEVRESLEKGEHELSLQILERAKAHGLKSGAGIGIAGAMRRPKQIKNAGRYRLDKVAPIVDTSKLPPPIVER